MKSNGSLKTAYLKSKKLNSNFEPRKPNKNATKNFILFYLSLNIETNIEKLIGSHSSQKINLYLISYESTYKLDSITCPNIHIRKLHCKHRFRVSKFLYLQTGADKKAKKARSSHLMPLSL